jgi:hypothetical protein
MPHCIDSQTGDCDSGFFRLEKVLRVECRAEQVSIGKKVAKIIVRQASLVEPHVHMVCRGVRLAVAVVIQPE